MKSPYLVLACSFSLVLAFTMPQTVLGGWMYVQGEDDMETEIELDRVDSGTHSPLHELDEGQYGYWRTSSEFDMVLDFGVTGVVISPYTWADVLWVPGPKDYIPPIGALPTDWQLGREINLVPDCPALTEAALQLANWSMCRVIPPEFWREEC